MRSKSVWNEHEHWTHTETMNKKKMSKKERVWSGMNEFISPSVTNNESWIDSSFST